MTKRQTRMVATIVVLVLILAAIAGWFYYYRNTKQLAFDLAADAQGAIAPPTFLYSFSGQGKDRMQRPVGIDVVDGNVYVADAVRRGIHVFDEEGNPKGSFGASQTVTPLYVAYNPKDKLLYVSDRRTRSIHRFTLDGKFKDDFDPNLPKDQLPKFKTNNVKWAPVGVTFADDGTMYVTEILKGHRLLVFNPDGSFKKSTGDVGIVNDPKEAGGIFQFPNEVMVVGNEVYVADSNNRRVQVFDRDGTFKRIIVTQGLPRGIVALNAFPSDEASAPARFVTVDTLAHDATIWTTKGEKLLSFGEQGVLDGQFNYPDGVALGQKNKIFITDTANGRVQVWGWPAQVTGLPTVSPKSLWVCALPLLLLPFLLFLRRKRFVATPDFVTAMIEIERADLLPKGRRQWLAVNPDYEEIEPLEFRDIKMADVFEASEYSDSDAKALMEKLEIEQLPAARLALAQRAKVFCTEDPDLRRMAKVLEVDVINAEEFVKRYMSKKDAGQSPVSGSDS